MNACTRTSAVVTLIYLRSYISKVVEYLFNYIVDMKRHRYGVIENDADITRLICRLDDISSYFNRRQPWGQSEPRMENEKFGFVSIQFQFVSSHPVSDIDKTAFNPGNCSGKINAIITTEGVYS